MGAEVRPPGDGPAPLAPLVGLTRQKLAAALEAHVDRPFRVAQIYEAMHRQGARSVLAKAVGGDLKGKLSPVAYTAGIVFAFYQPWVSIALYVLVAIVWLVPDRRIERVISEA